MRKDKNRVGRPSQEVTLDKKQEVRCTQDDKDLWKEAAELEGVSSSELMRKASIDKAKRIIKKHKQGN